MMSVVLMLAVLLGPYSFAIGAHMQHHDAHASMSHHGDADHHNPSDGSDHKGLGHALTHCGSGTCMPTFFGTAVNSGILVNMVYMTRTAIGDDVFLPSLYLDSDPPVPRLSPSLI